jgi:hypothetical protein
MQWVGWVTAVGVVALAVLIWVFMRLRSQDQIVELINKRKASSKIVCRANYMEGIERIPVALALVGDTVFYENSDLQASLELAQIEEIEYDDETATGHSVVGKALRLRSHGHCFEFVFDEATAREWEKLLPARHMDEGTAQAV